MMLAWPVGAVWETGRYLRRTPEADRPARLMGWALRAGHMLALALVDNVPPRSYVAYRLHVPHRRFRIGASFYGQEVQLLTSLLNRLNGAVEGDVQDKARFADLCHTRGLPCIPTLAVFQEESQSIPSMPFLPGAPDIWVKDLAGYQGSGAARWVREGDAYRHAWQGDLCSLSELVEQWRRHSCIIQPCLGNHPSLEALSDGSLAVFRVITGIDRAGHVVVVDALAQFPCGGWGEQQIFAGVGAAGDILSPHLWGLHPVTQHPDTGANLVGVKVPFWPEALNLVVRAHGEVPEFSRFVFLGWDVALTAQGALLIETNAGWGGLNHQLGEGIPLGLTALPGIALDHLEGHAPCG